MQSKKCDGCKHAACRKSSVECRTGTWLTGHRFCFAPLDLSHVIGAAPIASHIRSTFAASKQKKKKLKWKTCSFVNHFYAEDVMTSSVFSLIGWHTTSFPFIFIEDKVLLHADMLINHKSFVSQARLCFRSHRLSILERVFSFFRFARCTMINGSVCNDKTCSAHLAIFESHFPRWPPLPPPLPPYGFLSFSFYIIIHCIASRFHGLMFQFFYRRQYGINSCQATSHTNTMVLGAERTMWIKHTNRLAMRCGRTVHSLFTRWHVAKHFHFTNMHSHGSDNNIANAIERHEECVASQFVPMRCLLRVVSSICVRIFQRIEFDEEAKEWQKEKKICSHILWSSKANDTMQSVAFASLSGRNGNKAAKKAQFAKPTLTSFGIDFCFEYTGVECTTTNTKGKFWQIIRWKRTREAIEHSSVKLSCSSVQ